MNTDPEATSNICNFTITINRRKQTETIYNQTIRFQHILFIRTRITNIRAFQLPDNLYQMILIYHMWSNDQFHFWMIIEIFNKQILIRLPGTTSYEGHGVILKEFHQRQIFRLLTYLQHPVETRIADHCHTVDANLTQITFGTFILYE